MIAIAAGDQEAFSCLASRYLKRLYGMAFRMFPQTNEAEDIVQDVLLHIWNKAPQWNRRKGASVKTWIYRLSYNICIDTKRKKHVDISEGYDINAIEGASSTDTETVNKQTKHVIAQELAKLPDRQRMAMIFYYYEDLSQKEISRIMKTSVKAVESLLIRGKRTMKQALHLQKGGL